MSAAGPPPGQPQGRSCMGVIRDHAGGNQECKQSRQRALLPAQSRAPGICSRRGTDPRRHCYSQPWKADTTYSLQGCSARIRSRWDQECGWAPRHHVCVTEEQPGGRGGSVQPRPAAEGTEPPAEHPAPAGGTGEPRRPRREPRGWGEECSVPEVKPSGGKVLRRGGVVGG